MEIELELELELELDVEIGTKDGKPMQPYFSGVISKPGTWYEKGMI
jgi:hypothetical protein